MTRKQKIEFLRRLHAGRASLQELRPVEITLYFGYPDRPKDKRFNPDAIIDRGKGNGIRFSYGEEVPV